MEAGKPTNLCSIVCRAKNQLGSSVVARADIRDVWLIFYQDLCTTEVTKLQNASAWVQQEVLWLDVAMADALRVDVCEGTEELVDVELDFEGWHGRLHLVEISRSPVDGFRDIFLYEVEVDFILLPKPD